MYEPDCFAHVVQIIDRSIMCYLKYSITRFSFCMEAPLKKILVIIHLLIIVAVVVVIDLFG